MSSIDYTKKIALLGDAQVGKTSLQSRYLGLGFKKNYVPTLGVNFSSKDFQNEKHTVRVLIADMAGQRNFKPMREKFFLGVTGCILVFDVTRPYDASQQIIPWVDEVLEFTQSKGTPLAIVGNKIDLQFLRQIPLYSGMNAAVEAKGIINQNNAVEYFETSAKEGTGVDEAFNWLIDQMMKQIEQEES